MLANMRDELSDALKRCRVSSADGATHIRACLSGVFTTYRFTCLHVLYDRSCSAIGANTAGSEHDHSNIPDASSNPFILFIIVVCICLLPRGSISTLLHARTIKSMEGPAPAS